MRFPSRDEALPAIDEHIVSAETRAEIIDGRLHFAPPADEPHATAHIDLAYLLRAHVAPGYRGAVDMLTRTSHTSDFAPDASVYPAERDPATGGRKLEELAFEIASEQSIGVPTMKARELAKRGVRRVFCILVKKRAVLEWSREDDDWRPLPDTAMIEDPTLVRPLPARALLDAADADTAAVQALLAKGSRAIEAIRLEGLAMALLTLLAARGLAIDAGTRERISSCSSSEALKGWISRAAVASTLAEIFSA
jgi:hypothetical protein